MRRVVCVWLPTWPTDRLRRQSGAQPPASPVIVAERQGSRRMVVAADTAAQALGVRVGVTVALAQATTPALTVVDADAQADAAALEKLAVWALRYSPLVAHDAPDGLVLDITGASHLFGGEAALLADLGSRLARAGIAARMAIADTWAAAWGLARFASGTIAPDGHGLEAFAHLPVAALRLEPGLIASLCGLGFDTVGEIASAPRASLALRFGSGLTGRLDRVAGRTYESFEPVHAPCMPYARLSFAEPLGHLGGLEVALKHLASDLCGKLESERHGARRIDLHLRRVDNHVAAVRVSASRATRDPVHVVRLFGSKLETVDPGFGIEAVVLAATQTEQLEVRQLAVPLTSDKDHGEVDLAALVDRITARIGERRVYRVVPAESDVPERGVTLVSPLAQATGKSWEAAPRPQRLLDPPEPVDVTALLPDHPPALYVWQGRRMRVTAADGPECVAGEWWLSDAEVFSSRDYFRVEDESGGRAWLFRANAAGAATRWFIQGVFA